MDNRIVVLVFFLALIYSINCDCGQDAVSRCLDPISNDTSQSYLDIKALTDAMEGYTYVIIAIPDDINKACSDFRELDECISKDMEQCEDITHSGYLGIQKTYNYLCSKEGLEAYKKSRDCLLTPNTMSDEHECIIKFRYNPDIIDLLNTSRQFMISFDNYDPTEGEAQCNRHKLASKILDCQIETILEHCDSDASVLYNKIVSSKLTAINLEQECIRYDPNYNEDDGGQTLNVTNYKVCEDGSDLISKEKWCDQQHDCQDGSDERNCTTSEANMRNLYVVISVGISMFVIGMCVICCAKFKENRWFKEKILRKSTHRQLLEMEGE